MERRQNRTEMVWRKNRSFLFMQFPLQMHSELSNTLLKKFPIGHTQNKELRITVYVGRLQSKKPFTQWQRKIFIYLIWIVGIHWFHWFGDSCMIFLNVGFCLFIFGVKLLFISVQRTAIQYIHTKVADEKFIFSFRTNNCCRIGGGSSRMHIKRSYTCAEWIVYRCRHRHNSRSACVCVGPRELNIFYSTSVAR